MTAPETRGIQITNFRKLYGKTEAVKEVSLSVERGELFGLIGPDGAGKTTLMRAVCTLLVPDGGTVLVQGRDAARDIAAVRARLGYMPQRFSLYQDLTVEQNLRFFADLFQVRQKEREGRLEELYRFSRLGPFKKRRAGALSGGMRQKLALSCALVHTPETLVLDEPTTGVDPVSRHEFWEILRAIQKEGTTILVSTAYLDEADRCDRVALMHEGRIVAVGTPEEIKAGFRHVLYRLAGRDARELRRFFSGLPQVHSTQLFGDAVHVVFAKKPGQSDWEEWRHALEGKLEHWSPERPSVEDVFLELIGSGR
ncbi:MAG: ABC transporter ATP-binding protein [Candidatus Eiseniibacteriota bacterium]|nr:MAG: ABC transporter ATP-binding protein [Candidatus Eisenbacteria bacterium]